MTRSKFKHAVIDADWLISEDSHPVDREFVAVAGEAICALWTAIRTGMISHPYRRR